MNAIDNGTSLVPDILRFAPLLHAFLECSDDLRKHAGKLLAVLIDPTSDDDDRQLAAMTLADVLFPNPSVHEGTLGLDLQECEAMGAQHSVETREALDRMDHEETTFANRLRSAMEERGVTQLQLAEQLGIGQPAISMMLQRSCRPQRRTVLRLAEALRMEPQELWPGIEQRLGND